MSCVLRSSCSRASQAPACSSQLPSSAPAAPASIFSPRLLVCPPTCWGPAEPVQEAGRCREEEELWRSHRETRRGSADGGAGCSSRGAAGRDEQAARRKQTEERKEQ
eukprot:601951-Hanusia_phi.AAC.1